MKDLDGREVSQNLSGFISDLVLDRNSKCKLRSVSLDNIVIVHEERKKREWRENSGKA